MPETKKKIFDLLTFTFKHKSKIAFKAVTLHGCLNKFVSGC